MRNSSTKSVGGGGGRSPGSTRRTTPVDAATAAARRSSSTAVPVERRDRRRGCNIPPQFDIDQVTTLITDSDVHPSDAAAIRSRGVDVVIAP